MNSYSNTFQDVSGSYLDEVVTNDVQNDAVDNSAHE